MGGGVIKNDFCNIQHDKGGGGTVPKMTKPGRIGGGGVGFIIYIIYLV